VRGKIAARINETLFKCRPDPADHNDFPERLYALTSDVGLQIFIVPDERRRSGCAKILCNSRYISLRKRSNRGGCRKRAASVCMTRSTATSTVSRLEWSTRSGCAGAW